MTDSAQILVVDDDTELRAFLTRYLDEKGFSVRCACTAAEARARFDDGRNDLLILDIRLPDGDGLSLLKEARGRWPGQPVILLTGEGEEIDKVVGLELGADDYVAKPFGARELLARIRAVLRRADGPAAEARAEAPLSTGPPDETYRFAGWELNASTRRLTSPAGAISALSKGEFNLLYALVTNPGRVLSREQLLVLSRRDGDEVFDRSIDVNVHRIRHKIEVDATNPAIIKTERGVGYSFAAAVRRD